MHQSIRMPRRVPVRISSTLVTLLFACVQAACSSSGGATQPPSGACLTAGASNTVELHAKDIKFSAPCIEAAAGQPIVIKFFNDESQPHDVVVYKDSSKAQEIVRGEIITGPNAQTTVTVPPQQPAQLYFECSVHNAMNGALVVRAAPSASP
jgi:plastocyanin